MGNNRTIEEIKIKKRGDGVYDIYVNGQRVAYAGCYINALERVRDYIETEAVGAEEKE